MEKSEKCQPKLSEEEDGQKNKTKLDESSRIVGGQPTTKPMPWMVLIHSEKYDFNCGGSLVCSNKNKYFIKPKCFQINNQFVVTAAHCFCKADMCQRGFEEVSSRPNTIKVRLLENYL